MKAEATMMNFITERLTSHEEQIKDHRMMLAKLNEHTSKLNDSIEETYELICECFEQISNLRKQQVADGIERRLQRKILLRKQRIRARFIKYIPHILIGTSFAVVGVKTLDVTKVVESFSYLHF